MFMRKPRAAASLTGSLVNKAIQKVPTILPKQALKMTKANIAQDLDPLIVATLVFNPLAAKYKGKNRVETKSSSFSIKTLAKGPSFGIISPMTNAPKSACIPIASVAKLAINTIPNVTQM